MVIKHGESRICECIKEYWWIKNNTPISKGDVKKYSIDENGIINLHISYYEGTPTILSPIYKEDFDDHFIDCMKYNKNQKLSKIIK